MVYALQDPCGNEQLPDVPGGVFGGVDVKPQHGRRELRPPDAARLEQRPYVRVRPPELPQRPPDLRPDRAPSPLLDASRRPGQPTIGMVSLGCPKALVDSERILTRLRAEGYAISPDYQGAGAVIVNTCGFLD